jgi:hypothetical protein
VQSQLDIAQKLNVSPQMVLQIAHELTSRGYLEEVGGDCSTPHTACSGCPAGSVCKGTVKTWLLTEKGKRA